MSHRKPNLTLALVHLAETNRRVAMYRIRRGVTLMETIFAIGVILTGLLGLAALIPIAAGNARATLEIDQSISESTSVAAAGVARGTMDLDSLVIYDKEAAGSPIRVNPTTYAYTYVPSNQPQTIQWKIEGQTNQSRPMLQTSAAVTFGKLESPGYGHHPLSSGLTSGICIDPIGMPALPLIGANAASEFPAVGGTDNAFEYSRFPYYTERYNPLTPPNQQLPAVPPAPGWPMSPRMYRATLISDLQDNGTPPVHPREMMPQFASRRIFTGFAGFDVVDGPESDDPHGMLVSRTLLGGNYVDTGRRDSAEYTWFATLAPPIDGGSSFRQSIIVVRQRIAPVPLQANDPLALNNQDHTVGEAEDNQRSERLTWIGQAVGFTGGAGGEVLVYGSQSTVPDVRTNEWVMLSSQPHTTGASPTPVGPAVHRWFRVTTVDEPEFGIINGAAPTGLFEPNWPGSGTAVWRRWITLSGPDWSFGHSDVPPLAANDLRNDTFCTIVEGAVSVFQSEVQLN